MSSAKIVSTGRYVPERSVPNSYFNERYQKDIDTWLRENVGIETRHFASDEEVASDLAVNAGRQALERADVAPSDVDLLIVATDTPDYLSPATASVVQFKMGLNNAGVFDLNNACAAFVSGLITGSKFIITEPSRYKKVLIIGTYAMSKFINWDDFKTASIFADGAGAALLTQSDRPGFLASTLKADGQYHDYMGIYVGGSFCVPSPETLNNKHLVIAKRYPPELNAVEWPKLVREVIERSGERVTNISRIYFTQINLNTIKDVMKELDLPLEKTHWIMNKWGYTGSACVPMTLDDHITLGRGPKPGDLVVLCASGGGYAMAATAVRW